MDGPLQVKDAGDSIELRRAVEQRLANASTIACVLLVVARLEASCTSSCGHGGNFCR